MAWLKPKDLDPYNPNRKIEAAYSQKYRFKGLDEMKNLVHNMRGLSIKGKILLFLLVFSVLCAPTSIGSDVPSTAASWNKNGTSLYSQGKYNEALQAFDIAIELDATKPKFWYNKGNALYSLREYDDAINAYDKVLELDPQHKYAWVAKGLSLCYLKKYDEAIRCFDKALAIDSQYAEAQKWKDSALRALERTTEANEAFAKASELKPKGQEQITDAAKPIQAVLAPVTASSSTKGIHIESWQKTFGWSGSDYANSVQQTTDGGYIIAGATSSYGGRAWDAWLVKTDSSGNELWNRIFNRQGFSSDWAHFVQQTTDYGYIIAGYTSFMVGDAVNYDVWLIKTDSSGNMLWNRTFGGPNNEKPESIQQTTDDGYLIGGNTDDAGTPGHYTWLNGWQIKTDAEGNKLWEKTFSEEILSNDPVQTTDGGYIIAGTTKTYSSDEPRDVTLIKTDSSDKELWNRTFGGPNDDWASSVQQTNDGGYIIAGNTKSYSAGAPDAWLIKTDANGNVEGLEPQFIGADERRIHFPHDPVKAEEWNSRGIALLNQGNYKEAINAFDKAISFDGNNTEAWEYYWAIYFDNYEKEQPSKPVKERSGITKLSGQEGETVFKDVADTATFDNFGHDHNPSIAREKADAGYVAQQTSGGWLDAPGF